MREDQRLARATALSRARIGILGPPIEHRDSLVAMLQGRAENTIWIPDSLTFRKEKGHSVGRIDRWRDQLRGTRDPVYLAEVIRTLDDSDVRVLIAYWGTIPLPDLVAIKRLRPGMTTVLMVLCYPLAMSPTSIFQENSLMRFDRKYIDGFLFPSDVMAEYFQTHIFRRSAPESTVLRPCWPQAFQSAVRRPPVKCEPNLVYTGRTDLSGRTVHVADDVRPLMRSILDKGIELHHGYSPETDDGHPLRKPFPCVPLNQLIGQLNTYDASLVLYNTAACARDVRFRLTVPDRVITSVAAGVPLALPTQGYEGSKAYLKNYPAVIEFGTVDELSEALADRKQTESLREAAWSARSRYTAEEEGGVLASFLENML